MGVIKGYSEWRRMFEQAIASSADNIPTYHNTIEIKYRPPFKEGTDIVLYSNTYDDLHLDLLKKESDRSGTIDLNQLTLDAEDKELLKNLIKKDIADMNALLNWLSKKPRLLKRIFMFAMRKTVAKLGTGYLMKGSDVITRAKVIERGSTADEETLDFIFGKDDSDPIKIDFTLNDIDLNQTVPDNESDSSHAVLEYEGDITIRHSIIEDVLDLPDGKKIEGIRGPVVVKYWLNKDDTNKTTSIGWEVLSIGVSFETNLAAFKFKISHLEKTLDLDSNDESSKR